MSDYVIYLCEDSLEGIFSGIYEIYERKKKPDQAELYSGEIENYRLFAEYCTLEKNLGKAAKVAGTIQRDFGNDTYLTICRALSAESGEKANAVYQAIACGLCMEHKRELMGNLANPYVRQVFEFSRNAMNEIHHLKGFLRFAQLNNGILFARIGPKNNIITFLAPHFADRLSQENFVIYDELRCIFAIHPKGKPWFLTTQNHFNEDLTEQYSDSEIKYQELFRHFCHTISIESRENRRLQRQMLPLRFQKYMMEFSIK